MGITEFPFLTIRIIVGITIPIKFPPIYRYFCSCIIYLYELLIYVYLYMTGQCLLFPPALLLRSLYEKVRYSRRTLSAQY